MSPSTRRNGPSCGSARPSPGATDGSGNGSQLLLMPAGGAGLNIWLNQTCAAQGPASVSSPNTYLSWRGDRWCYGLFSHTLGNILIGPNPPYPSCDINIGGGDTDDSYGFFGMSSNHPGGANILMADGSVRFLKNSVSQLTVWALGSRNQGEDHQLRLLLSAIVPSPEIRRSATDRRT